MSRHSRVVAIVSDIHFASPAEAARHGTMLDPIGNPLRRWAVVQYRRWIWLRDPFAHNHLLDRFLTQTTGADLAVANGDYSCDSAYVGVMDEAAFQSATLCLDKLRGQFGARLRATIGDHEIGKKMLAADAGGLRLASLRRSECELKLEQFWQLEVGRYSLFGITSTLAALPVYESETRADELEQWRELHARHIEDINRAFASLQPQQRVLLFCHDPSALPYLARQPAIRSRLAQIERTIIGHLHSPAILWPALKLSGIPPIRFLGHTPLRLSTALREARQWKPFNILLCPAIAGIQLRKDGGYFTAELDPDASRPARFTFHPLRWEV